MNYKNYIKGCILLFALSMSSVAAYAADDDDIIELCHSCGQDAS